MSYEAICISSGHGLKIRGASSDICDEVDEARKVTDALAAALRSRGVAVSTFHDNVSTTQDENLRRITDFHNSCDRELDISVHFNAFERKQGPMGTEVLYYSDEGLAAELSAAIADVGLIDRGAKQRTDLYVLANTEEKAVLLEVCFCDSDTDVEIYRDRFDDIIDNLAFILSGVDGDEERPDRPQRPERPDQPDTVLFYVSGKCSHFGGPGDTTGVSQDEGLAFHHAIDETNQHLFLPINAGTGLARQLNPYVNYVACRWDYSVTSKDMLATSGDRAMVRSIDTNISLLAFPADWGPNENTGRVADLSPGLMEALGISTDDEVEVIYPWRE